MQQFYNIKFKFNAAHSMSDITGKHPHTFSCIVLISKDANVYTPFFEYENHIKKYFNQYRGQYLNEHSRFKSILPTLENMADVFFKDIEKILTDEPHFTILRLELGDSPTRVVSVERDFFVGTTLYNYTEEDLQKIKNYRLMKNSNVKTV